jgi:hypothetical protein
MWREVCLLVQASRSARVPNPAPARLSTPSNHRSIRSGRFVSTWNVCRWHAAMTPNTAAIASSGSASWKRSLIELTNTRRGLRQCNGSSSFDGISFTRPVQRGPAFVMEANPRNGSSYPLNRAAIRSA